MTTVFRRNESSYVILTISGCPRSSEIGIGSNYAATMYLPSTMKNGDAMFPPAEMKTTAVALLDLLAPLWAKNPPWVDLGLL